MPALRTHQAQARLMFVAPRGVGPQRAVGMANSAPSRALTGQRCMTDFCRV